MAEERKARYRDMSEGLLRQRRNLLIISILLPFIITSGATIEDINLFGTKIKIENPIIINYSLYIIFFYFLLRYWQYYKDESFVKDIPRLKNEHIYYLEYSFLHKKAKKVLDFIDSRNIQIILGNPLYSSSSGWYTHLPKSKDIYLFPFYLKTKFYFRMVSDIDCLNGKKDSTDEEINEITHKLKSNKQFEYIPSENGEPLHFIGKIEYNLFLFIIFRFIGYMRFIFQESYFTDYILPFLISFIAIIICILFHFL